LGAARAVMMAMIEAHARMYDAVRAADDIDADHDGAAAEVGLVLAMVPVRPKDPGKPLDQAAARNVFYLYNSVFLNAAIRGELDENLDRRPVARADLAGRMDFLGINYYTRMTVAGTETASVPQLSPLTNFDPLDLSAWESYPRRLYEMAMEAKGYGVPIYVTENGTASVADPPGGIDYLVPHVSWLRRAIRDGADARGYFWWSLIDNYEWNHGMNVRFGLYAVDTGDPGKSRSARPAADVYRRIAAGNRVPDDLVRRYPAPEP
jgi:beta-glucosidase/6-phospho-beta-glucosidase/beta-galactosidase